MGSAPRFETLPERWRERVRAIVAAAARDADERARRFEFATYVLAAVPLRELQASGDEELVELVRAVVRVELRVVLETAWPERRFDAHEPDMGIEVRPRDAGAVTWFEPRTAFVAGRYRKLSRELSQTLLHCGECRGRGMRRGAPCAACGGSGRAVAEAVEDFVRPSIEGALGGRGATFHGSGREDVDVRMLGAGRPFVVSVDAPVRRSFDAAAVARAVREASGGRVEIDSLRVVGRAERRRITSEHGAKAYRAVVTPVTGRSLPEGAQQLVAALSGATLAQRNPRRVPRRADVIRERRVRELVVEEAGPDRLVLRVVTDPGLYVKEMVSGDDGRTTPSVAALLGTPCVCAELDVLGVDLPDAAPPVAQDNR